MKEPADEQLMQSAAAGDLDAFEEIVLRFQGQAWRTAFRFLGDSMEAEDVAQETFLRLLDAASRYRPEASFRTYFYRILTRICIDRARRKRPATPGDLPDPVDPSPDPAQALMARERALQVREALDTLPPNQKAAVILKHYEGLNYVEISRVLDVSPKAVEGLLGRARAALHARLSSV